MRIMIALADLVLPGAYKLDYDVNSAARARAQLMHRYTYVLARRRETMAREVLQ